MLDSVLHMDGPDPFYAPTLEALPRVLRALCRAGCSSFTADPLEDLRRVVRRMGERGVRGQVVDPRGRRHPARVSRGELFLMLIAGDFDPALRAALPGAVRAALDGDSAPLVRLGRRSFSVEGEPAPPRLVSTALFTATTCEEMRLPWARTAAPDPGERPARPRPRRRCVPTGVPALRPRQAARQRPAPAVRPLARLAVEPTFGPGPLPDVPVLLLEGEEDLRTPVEGAARVAARFPQAELVVAPATGHSALGRRIRLHGARFRALLPRPARRDQLPARPARVSARAAAATALRQVAAAQGVGGIRGRALAAVAMTLRDVGEDSLTRFIFDERDPDLARGGGLRGGHYRIDGRNGLHLTRVVFVPGVRVSGSVGHFGGRRQSGRLRLAGRVAGSLALRGRTVSGRLGGKRVRAVLSARAASSGLRAVAARLPGP